MGTALVVIAAVALLVWLVTADRSRHTNPTPADRDRERQLAELRGLAAYHHDVEV